MNGGVHRSSRDGIHHRGTEDTEGDGVVFSTTSEREPCRGQCGAARARRRNQTQLASSAPRDGCDSPRTQRRLRPQPKMEASGSQERRRAGGAMNGSRWQATKERSHRATVPSFRSTLKGSRKQTAIRHPAGVQRFGRVIPVAAPSSLATGYRPPRLRRDGGAVISQSSRRARISEVVIQRTQSRH